MSTITSDLSSVAFTRFTSSDDDNVKSCCTDCARAFRKEGRDNLKWRLLACFATICNPSSYSLRGRPSSLGIDARLIPNSLLYIFQGQCFIKVYRPSEEKTYAKIHSGKWDTFNILTQETTYR